MKTVILAAGKGTRMLPLTQDRPKPMIELVGRKMIEWNLEGLKQAEMREVCIVTGHLSAKLETYLGDGSQYGLSIHYEQQEEQDGTGGAVKCVREWTAGEPFMLLFGDILFHYENYINALEEFNRTDADAILAVNWMDDPYLGAAVYWNEETGEVEDIVEKPPKGTSMTRWNQAGLFVFKPKILTYVDRLKPSSRGEIELTEAISNGVHGTMKVKAIPIQHFRYEVGTPGDVTWLETQYIKTPHFLEKNVLGRV